MNHFVITVVTAAVPSGILYGIAVNVLLRWLGKSPEEIEAFLRKLYEMLDSHAIPILEPAVTLIRACFVFVYGDTARRRFCTSLFIGFAVSVLVTTYLWSSYKRVPPATRPTKAAIERSVDEFLFDSKTNPACKELWKKAFEKEERVLNPKTGSTHHVPKYDDQTSRQIRDSYEMFHQRLGATFASHSEHHDLSLLWVFEGSYLQPGLQIDAVLGLFLYNVLLDYSLATIVYYGLEILAKRRSIGRLVACFILMAGSSVCGFLISISSYLMLFSGKPGVFFDISVRLPVMALVVSVAGLFFLAMLVLWIIDKAGFPWERVADLFIRLFTRCVLGVFFLLIGMGLVGAARESSADFGFRLGAQRSGLVGVVYVLGASTLVPAGLCVLGLVATGVLKMTSESLRLTIWGYMRYTLQLKKDLPLFLGLIAGLSFVTGVLIALCATK